MDAGQRREALVALARHHMQTDCYCWSELYEKIVPEINALADQTKLDPAYIALCLVDDISDLVDEAEEAPVDEHGLGPIGWEDDIL